MFYLQKSLADFGDSKWNANFYLTPEMYVKFVPISIIVRFPSLTKLYIYRIFYMYDILYILEYSLYMIFFLIYPKFFLSCAHMCFLYISISIFISLGRWADRYRYECMCVHFFSALCKQYARNAETWVKRVVAEGRMIDCFWGGRRIVSYSVKRKEKMKKKNPATKLFVTILGQGKRGLKCHGFFQ